MNGSVICYPNFSFNASVNYCLKGASYDEITQEMFIIISVPNFANFTHLKLDSMFQLEHYFHKKLDYNSNLSLDKNIVLIGLVEKFKSGYNLY